MLAAYGSGAALRSRDEGKRILNIDIGGGTTKLALVEERPRAGDGRGPYRRPLAGGRRDRPHRPARSCRPRPCAPGRPRLEARRRLSTSQLDRVAETMADTLVGALRRASDAGRCRASLSHRSDRRSRPHQRRHGLRRRRRIHLRPRGARFRRHGPASRPRHPQPLDDGALPWPLLPAGECIRATALGASEYSVQLSGNTSYISKPGALLPRRNLQVLQPPFACDEVIDATRSRRRSARIHRVRPGRGRRRDRARLPLAGRAVLRAHPRLRQGIAAGLADKIGRRKPIYVMLDGDVAHTLGAILREELAGRERDPRHRRRRADGFRLHRSRPRARAVIHRAGDDQVARLQRRSRAADARHTHPPPRSRPRAPAPPRVHFLPRITGEVPP